MKVYLALSLAFVCLVRGGFGLNMMPRVVSQVFLLPPLKAWWWLGWSLTIKNWGEKWHTGTTSKTIHETRRQILTKIDWLRSRKSSRGTYRFIFRWPPNLSETQLSCTISTVVCWGAGGAQCSSIPLTLQAHLKDWTKWSKKCCGIDTTCVEKSKVGAICKICSEGSFLFPRIWISTNSYLLVPCLVIYSSFFFSPLWIFPLESGTSRGRGILAKSKSA